MQETPFHSFSYNVLRYIEVINADYYLLIFISAEGEKTIRHVLIKDQLSSV